MKIHRHRPENGNVLVFILITVILFVALSYAISYTTRAPTDTITEERSGIVTSEILEFSSAIEQAIKRMNTIKGTRETQISFENAVTATSYVNGNARGDQDKVFHFSGGNISYLKPHPDWLDDTHSAEDRYGEWGFTGNTCIPGVGDGTTNTCNASGDDEELIMVLSYIKRSICEAINGRLDVNGGAIPDDAGDAWDSTANFPFNGDFDDGEVISEVAADGGAFKAMRIGCFEGDASQYHFFRVLIRR